MKDKINSILSEAKKQISEAASESQLQSVKSAYVRLKMKLQNLSTRKEQNFCLRVQKCHLILTVRCLEFFLQEEDFIL